MLESLEARVRTQRVESRLDHHVGKERVAFLVGPLEPGKRLVLFPEPAVDGCYLRRGGKTLLRSGFQYLNDPDGFSPFPRQGVGVSQPGQK